MGSEALVIALVSGFFGLIGIFISSWLGNKDANEEKKFDPGETGEHAHTRTMIKNNLMAVQQDFQHIKDCLEAIDRRLEGMEQAAAYLRQQEQMAQSIDRLIARLNDQEE